MTKLLETERTGSWQKKSSWEEKSSWVESNSVQATGSAQANNYLQQGYVLLKNCINSTDMNSLHKLCQDALLSHGVATGAIEKAHLDYPSLVNRYFPRGHFSDSMAATIHSILADSALGSALKAITGALPQVLPDHSLVSWLPESVQPGFSGYHQDGPDDSVANGYPHIWIPITESRATNFKIIPYTHELGNLPHGMLGQFVKVQKKCVDELIQNEQRLSVNTGDALIFSTRALHCLTLNNSNEICWSLEFICRH